MNDFAGDLLERAEAASAAVVANPADGRTAAEAVVVEARRTRHVEALVVGLRARAWSARALLDGETARRLIDDAARHARRSGLDVRLGEVLIVRAVVLQELGRLQAAHRDLSQARALLGGRAAPPEVEFQVAVLHQNAGRLAEAAAVYRRLRRDPASPVLVRAKVANNLGLIESQRGHHGVAMVLLAEARGLAAEVGPALTAYFANGEAWVLAHAGLLPESLGLFDESERLFHDAGLPLGEILSEQADVMLELRLLPEAREASDRALEEFTVTAMPLMQAEARLRVARVALLAGDAAGAEEAAERAAASFQRQRRAGWSARAMLVAVEARMHTGSVTAADLRQVRRAAATLERLAMVSEAVAAHLTAGRAAAKLGRTSWATANFQRAHTLSRRAPLLIRLLGRTAAAESAVVRGERTTALRHCRAGLTDLERHRGRLGSTELRVLASAHSVALGEIALRTLTHSSSGSSSARDVFSWMERNRSAALTNIESAPVEDVAEELDLLASMRTEDQSEEESSPELATRHAALEQRVRRRAWERSVTNGPRVVATALADLQELLGGRSLVEYGLLDGDVLAAVVSGSGVSVTRLARLSEIRDELAKMSFALRTLSRASALGAGPARQLALARLARLRGLLLDPLSLPSDRELVVVPVDVLQSLPWSALHDAPVSLSPSASFWARTLVRERPAVERLLLVAGPELPAAGAEIRQLADAHPGSSMLVPPASTVSAVAESLEDATTAHFACHGTIRADNPMFSSLLLSGGRLTVLELELRRLAPHRVVLAACEATADVAYSGGEMLGFVSALIARGTAGVLGSVQLVPDAAAASFMVSVHDELRRHDSLATALHAARAALDLEDPADLVNWCGFTAYGAG